jgi:hypothetical protein
VSSCILPHNYQFQPASRSCMAHHQVLKDFPDKSQVLLHKNDNYIIYYRTWNEIKHTARNRIRWKNLIEALCSKMEWWDYTHTHIYIYTYIKYEVLKMMSMFMHTLYHLKWSLWIKYGLKGLQYYCFWRKRSTSLSWTDRKTSFRNWSC